MKYRTYHEALSTDWNRVFSVNFAELGELDNSLDSLAKIEGPRRKMKVNLRAVSTQTAQTSIKTEGLIPIEIQGGCFS